MIAFGLGPAIMTFKKRLQKNKIEKYGCKGLSAIDGRIYWGTEGDKKRRRIGAQRKMEDDSWLIIYQWPIHMHYRATEQANLGVGQRQTGIGILHSKFETFNSTGIIDALEQNLISPWPRRQPVKLYYLIPAFIGWQQTLLAGDYFTAYKSGWNYWVPVGICQQWKVLFWVLATLLEAKTVVSHYHTCDCTASG